MKNVKKIYSLIVQDCYDNSYKIKIDDSYSNTLAAIDSYTCSYLNEQEFTGEMSKLLKANILRSFIIYEYQNQTKYLMPCFNEIKLLNHIAFHFKNQSQENQQEIRAYLLCLGTVIMVEYNNNLKVNKYFNRNGNYMLVEILKNGDSNSLAQYLNNYRKAREFIILFSNSKYNTKTNPSSGLIELPKKILKSEERIIQLIDKEISDCINLSEKEMNINEKQKKINRLYETRNEIECSLMNKQIDNNGQMRLF